MPSSAGAGVVIKAPQNRSAVHRFMLLLQHRFN
jgi:hypothetical protein